MDGAQLQEGPPHRQDYARNRQHSHPTSSVCFSVSVVFIPSFSKDHLSDFLDHTVVQHMVTGSAKERLTLTLHLLLTFSGQGISLAALSGVLLWFS